MTQDDIDRLDRIGNALYRQIGDRCYDEKATVGEWMLIVAAAVRYVCIHLGGRDKTAAQMILDDIYHLGSANLLGDLIAGHIGPTQGINDGAPEEAP